MSRGRRALMIAILLILLFTIAGGGLLNLQGRGQTEENLKAPQIAVSVIRATSGSLLRRYSTTGTVTSERMLTVYPLVAGRVTGLFIEENQTILEGETIATIDSERYGLELAQAEAAYKAAKASYERTKRLSEVQSASEQRLDEITAQFEASQATLKLARLQLSYTTVTAPLSGTVLMRHVDQGQLVSSSVPIVTIADLQSLEATCQVPQKYYSSFLSPTKITVHLYLEDGAAAIPATVSNVSQLIDPLARSFEVSCRIENPRIVRPGMALTVSFILERREEPYLLPLQVLESEDGIWYVDSQGRAQKRTVSVRWADDTHFAVSKEISELDVILEGQFLLSEGQEVRIVDPGETL